MIDLAGSAGSLNRGHSSQAANETGRWIFRGSVVSSLLLSAE